MVGHCKGPPQPKLLLPKSPIQAAPQPPVPSTGTVYHCRSSAPDGFEGRGEPYPAEHLKEMLERSMFEKGQMGAYNEVLIDMKFYMDNLPHSVAGFFFQGKSEEWAQVQAMHAYVTFLDAYNLTEDSVPLLKFRSDMRSGGIMEDVSHDARPASSESAAFVAPQLAAPAAWRLASPGSWLRHGARDTSWGKESMARIAGREARPRSCRFHGFRNQARLFLEKDAYAKSSAKWHSNHPHLAAHPEDLPNYLREQAAMRREHTRLEMETGGDEHTHPWE